MPRTITWPGLASLDRRFTAVYPGDQIERLSPAGSARALIRLGILADAGLATTIPHCVCELKRPDCIVHVDRAGGAYRGYCNEWGAPLEVTIDQIQRYRFDWLAWATWLRRKNALDGPGPALGAGALFVGSGTVGGREYGLLVVAPGCRHAEDVIVPEPARKTGRALVALLLGEPVEDLPVDATIPAVALGADLGTIDGAVIEHALDAVPQTITPGMAKCMLYSHESPRGHPIDEKEYARLHRPDVRQGFDVFIDLLRIRVWRRGRACTAVLGSDGRATGKKLGDVAISLLADYVRRPGIPMVAGETPTYRGDATDMRSAAVMLSTVRRSVQGSRFIRTGARSKEPGGTTYVFESGGMSWCVLARRVAT